MRNIPYAHCGTVGAKGKLRFAVELLVGFADALENVGGIVGLGRTPYPVALRYGRGVHSPLLVGEQQPVLKGHYGKVCNGFESEVYKRIGAVCAAADALLDAACSLFLASCTISSVDSSAAFEISSFHFSRRSLDSPSVTTSTL